MSILTVGSLFSGIGGIDSGLERAGFQIEWQVEIDEYASKVLAKHWPNVARFRDIRECGKHNLTPVDLICGGFPCQDISQINQINPQGLDGQRSGLWSEFYRVICKLRPSFVLVENVSALLYRGMSRVLGDLARSGYDAEWQVLRACDFGLPHRRKRVFIVAYPTGQRRQCILKSPAISSYQMAFSSQRAQNSKVVSLCDVLSQAESVLSEPSVCGVDDGLPYRMERLERLGNAVVPQVAEYIGRCILASIQEE